MNGIRTSPTLSHTISHTIHTISPTTPMPTHTHSHAPTAHASTYPFTLMLLLPVLFLIPVWPVNFHGLTKALAW